MRKLFILPLAVVAVALACATGAMAGSLSTSQPAFTYAPDLGWWVHQALEMASEQTGTDTKKVPLPTYIRCFSSDTAFENGLRRNLGATTHEASMAIAYRVNGTSYINMRATTCNNARLFTGRNATTKPIITETTAGAMSALLHEALHRQGFQSERLTECYANAATKYAGLEAWWRYAPGGDANWAAAEKWGNWAMNLAFQYTRHSVAANYQMATASCLNRVAAQSWADIWTSGT
jgi:hypothetical protein